MRRLLAALFAATLMAAGGAAAQSESAPVELTGTLLKLRKAGQAVIAFRESSIPFSYRSSRGQPIGYSIELCKELVARIGAQLGRELAIEWYPVTPESRIDAITSGRADFECGSTTSNRERQKQVAFSPTIFVSGTKLLVKAGSPVRSFRDLGGRTVAVTAGTTNEKALRDLSAKFRIDLRLLTAADHGASFANLARGAADALAGDDVLLFGLVAENKAQGQYRVVGEFLSYDPYGVMYRRDDPQLAQQVNAAFHDLAEEGEMERQYKRWFMQRLPSGATLGLPMSAQLESIIRATAGKPE
jgi:ABC-type amino acid transport substrate-binding protein